MKIRNIFFDTEFIEGKQPIKFLGLTLWWTKPVIDLISIGLVNDDGDTYYAISQDFNLNHAWGDEWIKDNVLLGIYKENVHGDQRNHRPFTKYTMKSIMYSVGKPKDQIGYEILRFVQDPKREMENSHLGSSREYVEMISEKPEDYEIRFWAYYASTDWVALYQLLGKMIEAPACYPMYVSDLKNLMDFKGFTKEWKQKHCPDPENEHNALADAIWNKKLYEEMDKWDVEQGLILDQRDIQIDTFRSAAAGNNVVMKAEALVRLTHLPTGCRSEFGEYKSQMRNREIAMALLTTKVLKYNREIKKTTI